MQEKVWCVVRLKERKLETKSKDEKKRKTGETTDSKPAKYAN